MRASEQNIDAAGYNQPERGGMLLGKLSSTLDAVESEPARLKRVALMAELFGKTMRDAPDELLPCLAIATMQLTPSTRPLKLGVGESLVLRALAVASNRSTSELKDGLQKGGDLGTLAAEALAQSRGPVHRGDDLDGASHSSGSLRIREVHERLIELGALSGQGSQDAKAEMLSSLLSRASPAEATLLVRAVRGKLRSGLGAKGIRDALAQAASSSASAEAGTLAAEAEAAEAGARAALTAHAEDEERTRQENQVSAEGRAGRVEKRRLEALGKAARKAAREAASAHKAAVRERSASRRRAAALVDAAFAV